MKLSRTVLYAVGGVIQLGQLEPNATLSSAVLAKEGSMPERFLLQILRQLVVHRILRSERGVFGGYALARRLSDISLLDIIEAVDGPIEAQLPRHPMLPEECLARLQSALGQITTDMRNGLQSVTLAHIDARQPSALVDGHTSNPIRIPDLPLFNVPIDTVAHTELQQ